MFIIIIVFFFFVSSVQTRLGRGYRVRKPLPQRRTFGADYDVLQRVMFSSLQH